jgi:excisionase family DNA binding protein
MNFIEGLLIMSVIVFFLGLFIWYTGKFNVGSVRAEGRHVKAAGVVLMLPATGAFTVSLLLGMIFSDDLDFVVSILGLLTLIEFGSLIAASIIAYILIANPPNAPRLPGILGQLQDEARGMKTPPAPNARPATRPRPMVQHPLRPVSSVQQPQTYAGVLSVAEAAAYLKVSEAEVMALIEAGKLPAARINYTFRIARSVLDDMKNGER